MELEDPSDMPLEEEPNPRLFPRTNQLAKISFFMGIGCMVGVSYSVSLQSLMSGRLYFAWVFC